jgi:hypothetical protein
VPALFQNEDLFEYIVEERRPHYRWMLMAPPRSGSFWHIVRVGVYDSVWLSLSL